MRGASATTGLNDDDTISVTFEAALKGNDLIVTLAHEGRHVFDYQEWLEDEAVGGDRDLNHFATETNGWNVSSFVGQALGMKSVKPKGGDRDYEVWNRGWKEGERDTKRAHGIDTIMRYSNLHPTDTDTYSSEHHHRP